jgi:hypothetical protein
LCKKCAEQNTQKTVRKDINDIKMNDPPSKEKKECEGKIKRKI